MLLRKVQQQVYGPSLDILQRFNNLERSSPDFPDQLIDLLSRKKYESPIFSDRFDDEDRAWLVEYLDHVRVSFSLHPVSTEHV